MNSTKLSKRIWFNLILFGFMGQVAWAVENVYFNTFLFNYIGGTTRDISRMVALSAVTAVLAAFVMGTLSDKLGRRKVFISAGYIAWGITVTAFALISRENIARILPREANVLAVTVSVVIIMDCVMTFMGATSNDAAFNAWITDVTVPENRGVAEGALATLPILATVFVTAAFGAGVTAAGYPACFLLLGLLVSLCGVVGLFSIRESKIERTPGGSYLSDLFYGFRPSVIKENRELYLSLSAVCVFSVAVQIFLPYLFIYIQHFLKFDFNSLLENMSAKTVAAAAGAIVGFVAVTVLLGKLLDKVGKGRFIALSILVFIAGLVLASHARTIGVFGLLALIMLCGYGLLMIILNASVRDFTPESKAGQFQGVRMIFFVLLPMVIGPFAGNRVIEAFAGNYEVSLYINDFGEAVSAPVPEIFLAAAVTAALIFLPIIPMRKKFK